MYLIATMNNSIISIIIPIEWFLPVTCFDRFIIPFFFCSFSVHGMVSPALLCDAFSWVMFSWGVVAFCDVEFSICSIMVSFVVLLFNISGIMFL